MLFLAAHSLVTRTENRLVVDSRRHLTRTIRQRSDQINLRFGFNERMSMKSLFANIGPRRSIFSSLDDVFPVSSRCRDAHQRSHLLILVAVVIVERVEVAHTSRSSTETQRKCTQTSNRFESSNSMLEFARAHVSAPASRCCPF